MRYEEPTSVLSQNQFDAKLLNIYVGQHEDYLCYIGWLTILISLVKCFHHLYLYGYKNRPVYSKSTEYGLNDK